MLYSVYCEKNSDLIWFAFVLCWSRSSLFPWRRSGSKLHTIKSKNIYLNFRLQLSSHNNSGSIFYIETHSPFSCQIFSPSVDKICGVFFFVPHSDNQAVCGSAHILCGSRSRSSITKFEEKKSQRVFLSCKKHKRLLKSKEHWSLGKFTFKQCCGAGAAWSRHF